MAELKHKMLGEATVLKKEEGRLIVKLAKNGEEKTLLVPDAFELYGWEATGALKAEIDAVIADKKEKARIAREERTAAREAAKAAAAAAKAPAKRRSKSATATAPKDTIQKSFEEFLVDADYTEYTPKGAESTVYTYSKSVGEVAAKEGLSWAMLVDEIGKIVPKYDVGGAEEAFGAKSHSTVINALRCFEDFANSLSSTATSAD